MSKCHIESEAEVETNFLDGLIFCVMRLGGEAQHRQRRQNRLRTSPWIFLYTTHSAMWRVGVVQMFCVPSLDEIKIASKIKDGIWLGAGERLEENIIDIADGVAECRTTKGRPGMQNNGASSSLGR